MNKIRLALLAALGFGMIPAAGMAQAALLDGPSRAASAAPALSAGSSALVTLAYQLILGRLPDPAGLAYWSGQMDNDQIPYSEILAQLLCSAEYQASHPYGSAAQFIPRLYQTLLNRSPTPSDLASWNTGMTYLNLARTALSLPEFRTVHPEATVASSVCNIPASDRTTDAAPALSACIALTQTLAALAPQLYTLATDIALGKRSHLTIATQGLENTVGAPACLSVPNDAR